MNMQEMIYQGNRIPPVRLADGVYRGVPFYVLSFGTHPCAYVDIAPLGLHAINERDIDCHGGITYHRDYLATVYHEGNFLGWDYAHCMDYSGSLPFLDSGYKRWTTAEIVTMINKADTVDAVPVVRFRECKNWEPYGSKAARKIGDPLERYGGCEIWHGGHVESDFCSNGEEKKRPANSIPLNQEGRWLKTV